MGVTSTDGKPCAECKKPTIASCPYCHEPVHHGFGLHNENCSGKHEQRCSGARWSREIDGSKST